MSDNRICVCVGTWTLIMLGASLREARRRGLVRDSDSTTLVLYQEPSRHSPELEAAMLQVAAHVWPWTKVVPSRVLTTWRADQGEWPLPLNRWRRDLERELGVDACDEIWLPHIATVPDKALLEMYPRSKVALYECGTETVGSWPIRNFASQPWGNLLKALPGLLIRGTLSDHLASLRISDWRLGPAYTRRPAAFYSFMARTLTIPPPFGRIPQISLSRDSMLDAIQSFRQGVPGDDMKDSLIPHEARDVLALGTRLYVKSKDVSRSDELDFYVTILSKVIDKGYRIFWKDHPRAFESFAPDLSERLPGGTFFEAKCAREWPVEIFFPDIGFRHCVAARSSSLYYLKELYGVNVYNCAREWDCELLQLPAMRMATAVSASISRDFNEMPPFGISGSVSPSS